MTICHLRLLDILPRIIKNYSKAELVRKMYDISEAHGSCLLAARVFKANNPNFERFHRRYYFHKLKQRFETRASAN